MALAKDRDAIDIELRLLMAMLAAGEVVVKRSRPAKASKGKGGDAGVVALEMLATRGSVTAEDLLAKTGQTMKNANQTLARLCRTGRAKRVRKGVYTRTGRT